MNEKLMELLEEIQKNEELQEKMKACKDIEELYAVTTQYVDGYTIDELKTGLTIAKSNLSDELSDEELEMVAGGSKGNFNKMVENPPTWTDIGKDLVNLLTLGL